MSLKEQIGEIASISRSINNALHTVAVDDVRLGPLANAIVACPDLLNQIKVTSDVPPQPAPVMSNVGEVNLDELYKHAEKIEIAANILRQRTAMVREGELHTDDMLEPIDALHKLVALLPKRGPTVEVVCKADPAEAVRALSAEAIKLGLAGDPEISLTAAPGYEQLVQVFAAAHDQAAYGKGKERHANGLPFHEQRMQGISDLVGSPDGMVYQLVKKTTEGLQFDSPEKREHELLGALNYLAGIVIWLRRHEAAKPVEG